MPRTKATRKKVTNIKPNDEKSERLDMLMKNVDNVYNRLTLQLERQFNDLIQSYKLHSKEQTLRIPVSMLDKTVAEVKATSLADWKSHTTTCLSSFLNSTKKDNKRVLKRSISSLDEAESTNGTSGRRQSRRTSKKTTATVRASRSLSRSQMQKTTNVNSYKTPAHQPPVNTYGTVTPKMKPNTPQVLLRRPKQGEVALSLQGSPLFTGSVCTETVANVNIPLQDGRLLSIQPQRGLRMSQIPDLDAETKRQLETLRDNLNKPTVTLVLTGVKQQLPQPVFGWMTRSHYYLFTDRMADPPRKI